MSLSSLSHVGLCPDEGCKTRIYFATNEKRLECPNCGQTHSPNQLQNVIEIPDSHDAKHEALMQFLFKRKMPKKGCDAIQVDGLSNYLCKMLSPLLTKYGMDKEGNAKLLQELGHGEIADCGRLLGHRAFFISPEHIEITGYGRDQSGSQDYLEGLLDIIKKSHDNEERLIPIHADGDGHCLVHALSRAMTGREIFWHALRENLVNHLKTNLDKYKILFKDFIDDDQWSVIIDEADPYYISKEGFNRGLGNIHIFALANVLKRPIILLDSLAGINNVADYTAVFVPAMVEPEQCSKNMPVCVAWSGAGHNHFIPLVGVADKPLPTIPQSLIPNIWGVGAEQGMKYLKLNEDGSLTVGGGKPLQRSYLHRLIFAMEKLFMEQTKISPRLVSDMHFYIYQRVGFGSLHPDKATSETLDAFTKRLIFRCLLCGALSLALVDPDSLQPGGYLYRQMEICTGAGQPGQVYTFEHESMACVYDDEKDRLVPHVFPCSSCGIPKVREVDCYGKIQYRNGDPTNTPTVFSSDCCGYKHYWDGKEYENHPKIFELNATIQGKLITDKIVWFHGDSNPEYNSNSEDIANRIVKKYFEQDNSQFLEAKNRIRRTIQARLKELDFEDDDVGSMNASQNEGYQSQNELVFRKVKSKNRSVGLHDQQPNSSKSYEKQNPSKPISKVDFEDTHSSTVRDTKTTSKIGKLSNDQIRIRISTFDGRQETLTVNKSLSFKNLQFTIKKHFDIPVSMQVLKTGFPPKVIEPSTDDSPLTLTHGDKVLVEVKKDSILKTHQESTLKRGFHRMGPEENAFQNFLTSLRGQHGRMNENKLFVSDQSNDAAIKSVTMMAKFFGKTEWEYSIEHPELFRPSGTFYDQFISDIGKNHGSHGVLPSLPGKVFQYNAETDELELCLEPYGHFAIGPGINDVIGKCKARYDSASSMTGCRSPSKENTDESSGEREKNYPVVPEMLGMNVQNMGMNAKVTEMEDEPEEMDSQDSVNNEQLDENLQDSSAWTLKSIDTSRLEMALQKGISTIESSDAMTTVPKLAPGFTILGDKPAMVSQEEADRKRAALVEILRSKNPTH